MRFWAACVTALFLVACAKEQPAEPGKQPAGEPPPSVEPKTVEKPGEAPAAGTQPAAGEAGKAAEPAAGEAGKAAEPAAGEAGKAAEPAAGEAGKAAEPAAGGVGKAAEPAAGEAGKAAEPAAGEFASALPELAKSALPYLPEKLQAIIALDLVGAVTRLDSMVPLMNMLGVEEDKALQEELSTFIRSRIGLDPLAARGVVFAITPDPAFWMLVKGDFKLEKTAAAELVDVGGLQALVLSGDPSFVVLPLDGWGIALFDRQEAAATFVETIIARKGPPPTEPELLGSLGGVAGAVLAVGVDFNHPMIQAGWTREIPFPPPKSAALYVGSSNITARMAADDACINGILGALESARAMAKAAVAAQKANLAEMNLLDGISIILADRSLDRLVDFITPKRTGDTLSLSLEIDQFTTVTIVGSMAAVAIPAFLRYTRTAKVSEAQETLRKIRYGAEAYFCTPRVDEQGNKIAPHFPEAQAATPAAGTCCASLGGPAGEKEGRCEPDSATWQTPAWMALNFAMLDPHYFVYEFTPTTQPDGTPAFDASAYGDLDCNGVRSTFRLTCRGVTGGEDDCRLDCDEVTVENELE